MFPTLFVMLLNLQNRYYKQIPYTIIKSLINITIPMCLNIKDIIE